MKLSSKGFGGTSFHGTVIIAKPSVLFEKIGVPQYHQNDGQDKTNFDWVCETESGEVFTIYDWKEYRPILMNEEIEFHIGGQSRDITERARKEVYQKILG
jgi:hypothetical protein